MFDKFKLRGIKLPNENLKYKILSIDDIIQEVGKLVEKCSDVFEEVSPHDCQMMLHKFKWNCSELLEKFYEAESFDVFLMKNNIDLSRSLSSDDMTNSFFEANPLYKWCPNKSNGCKLAVKMDNSEVEEVTCKCGLSYCLKCHGLPHSPFPCILLHEWAVQLQEFKFLFEQNNVICPTPTCHEFYDAATYGQLTCPKCNQSFTFHENKLTRKAFPDYDSYLHLSDQLEIILRKKRFLIFVEDAAFCSTVCNLAQYFAYKLLSVCVFSFFLDKDYLFKNPSTESYVPMLDLNKNPLQLQFDELMHWIEYSSGYSEEEENTILDILYSIQQYWEPLFKLIKDDDASADKWIFKLPEIQEFFDKDLKEKEDCNNEDDKESCKNDVEEESHDNDMNDDGIFEEASDDDDIEEEAFVEI